MQRQLISLSATTTAQVPISRLTQR